MASGGASAIDLRDGVDVIGSKTRDSGFVLAVIISYEPDHELLTSLVEHLRRDAVVDALIVDNSESIAGRAAATAIAGSLGVELILNPRNLGVAEAQTLACAPLWRATIRSYFCSIRTAAWANERSTG